MLAHPGRVLPCRGGYNDCLSFTSLSDDAGVLAVVADDPFLLQDAMTMGDCKGCLLGADIVEAGGSFDEEDDTDESENADEK